MAKLGSKREERTEGNVENFPKRTSGPITPEDWRLHEEAEADDDAPPEMSENTRRALADVPKR